MITKESWRLIADAIATPKKYSHGTERRKLQAAVDLCLDYVAVKFLGGPMPSPINLRWRLNTLEKKDLPQSDLNLINATLNVLKHIRLLKCKEYTDSEKMTHIFCENHLKHLFPHLNYGK